MSNESVHKWLVFASACVVMVVPMGLFHSLGALFVPFMTAFQASRTEASLVQSVAVAVSLSTGFIHGFMVHRFGMVKTGLAGATLASLGLAVSFFATSIPFLIVTIGIATSMGSICMFIVSSAAVGQYFTGKQSLILLSVVNACVGVGGMVFPLILEYLYDKFDLRGTLLICAGLVMNTFPGAILWTKPQRKCEYDNQSKTKSKDTLNMTHGEISRRKNRIKSEKSIALAYNTQESKDKCTHNSVVLVSYIRDITFTLPGQLLQDKRNSFPKELHQKVNLQNGGETHQFSSELNPHLKDNRMTLAESIKHLVKNRSFVFFIAGMAFSYPPVMVLVTFIADAFQDAGLSTHDANIGLLLLHACGIVGHLLPGIMMQSRYIKTMAVPVFASLMAAGSMTGLILTQSLLMKLLFSSLSGIPYGMFVSCFSVTSLDIVGADHLGNAIGLAFTCNGLANIAAGPVSGFIRDSTGSYMVVFLLASGVQFVAVILFVIAQIFLNNKKKIPSRSLASIYVTKL